MFRLWLVESVKIFTLTVLINEIVIYTTILVAMVGLALFPIDHQTCSANLVQNSAQNWGCGYLSSNHECSIRHFFILEFYIQSEFSLIFLMASGNRVSSCREKASRMSGDSACTWYAIAIYVPTNWWKYAYSS